MPCGKYMKGRPKAKTGTAGKANKMNAAKRTSGVVKKAKK